MTRYGIYGGTFNPVHHGHLITAESVREQMHLDKVLFIPSASPPHKDNDVIDFHLRKEMLNLAISSNKYFEVSEIEYKLSQQEKSYTVNTLTALHERLKDRNIIFYLILGMDNLIELETWKEPGRLFLMSQVLVINRPGYLIQDVRNEFSRQVTFVPVPDIDISSTDLRWRIREKKSIKYFVPEPVEKFIKENKLYIQD